MKYMPKSGRSDIEVRTATILGGSGGGDNLDKGSQDPGTWKVVQ